MQQDCTCPPQMDSTAQLCEACERDYRNWIEEEAWTARTEAMILPPNATEMAA